MRLGQLTGRARDDFLTLLAAARTDPGARAAVRRDLRDARVFPACVFRIEAHRQRALRALEEADPREPGRCGLAAMLDALSLFDRRPTMVDAR
jgi:hypothetical protein